MSVFFTRRFNLDTPTDRSKNRGGEFFVGPFRSFWVSKTNNSNFQCNLVINPADSNESGGIPLRLNQCQAFEEKPDAACVEFSVAQPGVWVEITFAQDDRISVGSVVVDINGNVSIDSGLTHQSSVKTATNVPSVLLPVNESRKEVSFQWKSGGSVWIGNEAELNNADFKNICIEWVPGTSIDEYRNKGALYWRTETGTAKYACHEQKE